MKYKTYYDSPFGKIILESDGDSLTVLKFKCHRFYHEIREEKITLNDKLDIFIKTKCWLDKYFRGEKPSIKKLKLSPDGNEFRQNVWKILCDIPYGKTITYGNIAKQIAIKMGKKSMSAQAIGNAVGHNPISIIIPCHRVIGANGSLIGYGGGIKNKLKLLELENVDMSSLYVPTKGSAL